MSIDDRFSANAMVDGLIGEMKLLGMAGFVPLIEQDRALIISLERERPGSIGDMRRCLRSGIVTRPKFTEEINTFTQEEIAKIMRDIAEPSRPAGKPWINPTPWKRGRKAQRIRV